VNTEITEYEKVSGWIYYDADCSFCRAMARRFQPLLAGRRFELLPLQTEGLADRLRLSKTQLMMEMRVLRPDGECFGGADALLEIARDFWWAWPLRLLGRVPAMRGILRAGYQWIARNRRCDAGSCEVSLLNRYARRAGGAAAPPYRLVDVLPLLALPMMALLLKGRLAPWVFMWAMAFALFGGCKWLTYREAVRRGLKPGPGRAVAYLLAWPGMDGAGFLDARNVPTKPQPVEWLFATAKMSVGMIILWVIARLWLPGFPLLAGWTGMIGVVFILHFGLFHLLALFWRQAGIAATPLMQNPILATSLAEFWGRRWNTAFNELAFRFVFRPLRRIHEHPKGWTPNEQLFPFTFRPFRWTGAPVTATLLVFGLSGLIHEAVISLPAGGGYGLPALYFLIQGFGTVIERSRLGRAIGLGRGPGGWLFTLLVTVTPVFLLFHPQFITHVILPMLKAIGAT
jgi:alginate O-acetyltransferase complex protein AlgI